MHLNIHDSSLGGSSDDDDFLGVLRGPSSFANAFLYVGLGVGLVCCILRILFCICPSQCIMSSRRKLKKKNAKVDADHTTSLLRGDSKRVSIARGPQRHL
ncbi:hypothetical protein Bhyg_03688 [Pseudolycoriella hygida]|uniref:Uncharacterized protein n=1 Tax=Pseudolycoriella hygida TaxID=35572 RepID=A0A9Q0S7Q8_9DIPT|nr:hypothetical protein Bhyg_03688 [Pseudolycoriella hygida]